MRVAEALKAEVLAAMERRRGMHFLAFFDRHGVERWRGPLVARHLDGRVVYVADGGAPRAIARAMSYAILDADGAVEAGPTPMGEATDVGGLAARVVFD